MSEPKIRLDCSNCLFLVGWNGEPLHFGECARYPLRQRVQPGVKNGVGIVGGHWCGEFLSRQLAFDGGPSRNSSPVTARWLLLDADTIVLDERDEAR